MDLHLSISKDLLANAINFSSAVTTIEKQVTGTIMESRKSLLCNNKEILLRKDNTNFYFTMANFDGAGVCELVGLYLLSILKTEFGPENIGL